MFYPDMYREVAEEASTQQAVSPEDKLAIQAFLTIGWDSIGGNDASSHIGNPEFEARRDEVAAEIAKKHYEITKIMGEGAVNAA